MKLVSVQYCTCCIWQCLHKNDLTSHHHDPLELAALFTCRFIHVYHIGAHREGIIELVEVRFKFQPYFTPTCLLVQYPTFFCFYFDHPHLLSHFPCPSGLPNIISTFHQHAPSLLITIFDVLLITHQSSKSRPLAFIHYSTYHFAILAAIQYPYKPRNAPLTTGFHSVFMEIWSHQVLQSFITDWKIFGDPSSICTPFPIPNTPSGTPLECPSDNRDQISHSLEPAPHCSYFSPICQGHILVISPPISFNLDLFGDYLQRSFTLL